MNTEAVEQLQELIESDITTDEQKAALKKAIQALQTDQLMEALKILVAVLGVISKIN
jgi:hypothetical protein